MMKRAIVPMVLLVLLAGGAALAGVPPSVWFEDHFDTYGATTRLAWCAPNWQETVVVEPGKTSVWNAANVDCHIGVGTACSGSQYVVLQGYKPAWSDATLETPRGACAETDRDVPPGGVSWEAYAAGSVQILNFKMTKPPVTNQESSPPLHAAIFLMDNNALGPQAIVGWEISTFTAQPQLHLPYYHTPWYDTKTGNEFRYYVNEGTPYNWTDPVDTCREFTAVYDPSDGSAKFYVYAEGADQLLWTGNAGAGRVSRSVYVRDYVWTTGGGPVDVVALDDLYVGTTAKPVVTAPVGGTFVGTNTPTIEWTHAFTSPAPTAYQVRVCSADNPAGPIVYDSGVIAGSATSKVTTALPTCTQLWAFVNEQYASWTGWSLQGNGGFYCATAAPGTPTVTSPSGTVVGCKPSVILSGTCYSQFEVKVTTDPGGSTVVWTSGLVSSLKSGASCEAMLVPGTQYYAFAQTTNPVGSSAWSAASAFQVTRTGEGTDIRDMNETWGDQDVLEHSAAAPDDGFGTYVGSGGTWAYLKRQVLPDPFNEEVDKYGNPANWVPCDWWPSDCDGQSIAYCAGVWIIPPEPPRTDDELVGGAHPSDYVFSLWKTHFSLDSNDMRKHRVANVSLDKGVTVMTYASGKCFEGENCGGGDSRMIGEEAQIYIMDQYAGPPAGKCMASFRYGRGEVGICVDNATWTLGSYTDDQIPERAGQGYHVVRITGRNRVIGDPTTCEWNYYLDENATPLLTKTGVMDQSIACIAASDIEDAIAIGCGTATTVGSWLYDWTAVNTDGDYAPGEWAGPGREYATVSEAVAQGRGQLITITGEAVITAIKLVTGSQVGFWVQDVATTDYSNIYIPSTVTTDVERGHKVTGISGMLQWSNATGASLTTPGFAVTTTDANWPPVTMQSKALVAGGYPTEYPDGTLTVGKFTQITGEITDLLYLLDGSYAVYLDDGCGLVDGRSADGGNALAKGVRVIVPEPWSFFGAIGDYYEARGICVSETAEGRTVRTLLGASFTEVAAAP